MYSNWHELTFDEIDKMISAGVIGNYLLGSTNYSGKITIKYVGRLDADLADRLKDHVGENGYTYFKFQEATSKTEAYHQECYDYHKYGGTDKLDNKIHPDDPSGINRRCPVCGR